MPAASTFDAGEAPRVRCVIGGRDYDNIRDYSWDSTIEVLGDVCAVSLENEDGRLSDAFSLGQSLQFWIADPSVGGGREIKKFDGIVTHIEFASDVQGGETIVIQGADKGWHLMHNCGPYHVGLEGITFPVLLERLIDPAWGLQGVRQGNDFNRTLRQGRTAAERAAAKRARAQAQASLSAQQEKLQAAIAADPTNQTLKQGLAGIQREIALRQNYTAILPPIQVQPGQMVGQIIIAYAQRQGLLLNVSSDGWLQFFTPNYQQPVTGVLHYHKSTESERRYNNVLPPVRITREIGPLYTRVMCAGARVEAPVEHDTANFNEGKFAREFSDASLLPFPRLLTFADGEAINRKIARNRAEWRLRTGRYNSFSAQYTVEGHSQNGFFWECDTPVAVEDTVHRVPNTLYCTGVHYYGRPGEQGGTLTTLTLREMNLLQPLPQGV
jgi:hypothetical protein